MNVADLEEEVRQAIKEELLKFVGRPMDASTQHHMRSMVIMILEFYDIPLDPLLSISDGKLTLKFKRKTG